MKTKPKKTTQVPEKPQPFKAHVEYLEKLVFEALEELTTLRSGLPGLSFDLDRALKLASRAYSAEYNIRRSFSKNMEREGSFLRSIISVNNFCISSILDCLGDLRARISRIEQTLGLPPLPQEQAPAPEQKEQE